MTPRPYHVESSAPYREGWLPLTDHKTPEEAEQSAASLSNSPFHRDVTHRVVGPTSTPLAAYKNGENVEL